MTTNGRQRIQIGESYEHIERVIRHHRTMISLGIETGYVEHRRDEVPVWRPINPVSLGLDQDWLDGVWRTIYKWRVRAHPTRSEPDRGFAEYDIDGTTIALPGADIAISPALKRFLRQHLR